MSARIAWLTTWLVFTAVFALGGLILLWCTMGIAYNKETSDRPFVDAGSLLGIVTLYGSPILGALVTAGYIDFRKRKERQAQARVRAGKCPQCGYDMRGSPSAICPECGCATPPKGTGG